MILFNTRGQSLTIWVVIAIALVGAMILFFSIENGPSISGGQDKEFSPGRFVDNCANRAVEETVDEMLPHGGFLDDSNAINYNGINVSYLCLNKGNYEPCISQHPVYVNDLKKEIIRNVEGKIQGCFDNLRKEVEARNGNLELGVMELNVDFATNRIFLTIDRITVIEKQDNTERFEEFKIEIVNPLYNFARIAMIISNEEAKRCYFEYVGYNVLHPETDIEKTTLDDGTRIYSIKQRQTDKEMQIAIRGCVIPAGF